MVPIADTNRRVGSPQAEKEHKIQLREAEFGINGRPDEEIDDEFGGMPWSVCDWEFDVERISQWLIVKVREPTGKPWELAPFTDALRSLLKEHCTYRVVLELREIDRLSSSIIGQLMAINRWIGAQQGVMRLCGLSPRNREVLRRLHMDKFFSIYRDRRQAVRACSDR